MELSLSKTTNKIGVRNVMCLMDDAIRCGELELLLNDCSKVERRIQRTKKAYWNALRFAGKISFDFEEVSAFETRSIRLEWIIREMQERYNSWKKLSGQMIDTAVSD